MALGQSHSIAMKFQGASAYPARMAYEVLNADAKPITAGYIEVQDEHTVYEIAVDVGERFAVQIYEDANRNSKLDRGLFTQPLEKYAFSNDAWQALSKPEVEKMLVQRTGLKTLLTFTLKSVADF
jgi:uncharacterized protein (DUF2141 family)